MSDEMPWRSLTLDPCERCGALRWRSYPSDNEGMRMVCGECNTVAPLEFRILAGQD